MIQSPRPANTHSFFEGATTFNITQKLRNLVGTIKNAIYRFFQYIFPFLFSKKVKPMERKMGQGKGETAQQSPRLPATPVRASVPSKTPVRGSSPAPEPSQPSSLLRKGLSFDDVALALSMSDDEEEERIPVPRLLSPVPSSWCGVEDEANQVRFGTAERTLMAKALEWRKNESGPSPIARSPRLDQLPEA